MRERAAQGEARQERADVRDIGILSLELRAIVAGLAVNDEVLRAWIVSYAEISRRLLVCRRARLHRAVLRHRRQMAAGLGARGASS